MFSSGEMIHLVFANESDICCGGDLLQLDLNQYLWARLHETEIYKSVYFLNLREGNLSVRSFGDKNAKGFEAKKGLFGGKKQGKELRRWLEDRLVTKNVRDASAVVCDLADFCEFFSDQDGLDCLEAIAASPKRSGILVLTASPVAERSRKLLLESPVFEAVKDPAVLALREGEQMDLFTALSRGKGDACVFFNAFTRDRARDLLLHAMFRGRDRFLEREAFEAAADYLYCYLNTPLLRIREPLFNRGALGWNCRYRDLYQELMKDRVWQRLLAQSALARQSGALAAYQPEDGETGVVRERDSAAGRCQQLWLSADLAMRELRGETGWQILREIRREARSVSTREENPQVAKVIQGFLAELGQVRDLGDLDTCMRILACLRFCLRQLPLPEGGAEEKTFAERLSSMDAYLKASKACYLERKNLLLQQQSGGSGAAAQFLLQQHRASAKAAEELLAQYEDLVGAFLNERFTPESSVSDLAGRLKEQLEKALDTEKDEEETEPGGEDEEEEIEYILGQEDYKFLPD